MPPSVLDIADAAHDAAITGFYFLPPMVNRPSYDGEFDATVSPVVEVCEWTGSSCLPLGPAPALYTTTTGPNSETVRADGAGEQFMVNWHTNQFTLDATKTYRIRVLVGNSELGHADVDVVSNGSQLRNVQTGNSIGLVDGKTLPIRFRVERALTSGVIYDPAVDFSATSNPNGVWSSGWTATLGSTLQLYPHPQNGGWFVRWLDQSINSLETPNFAKNLATDGTLFFESVPGQVSLHPGCHAHEFSVLRWTAPDAGRYNVRVQFFEGDGDGSSYGETTAHVLLNGQAATPLFYAASTSIDPLFVTTASLNAQDFLDFAVGTAGDCFFDTTPITLNIRRMP